jgi:hypothetical protein
MTTEYIQNMDRKKTELCSDYLNSIGKSFDGREKKFKCRLLSLATTTTSDEDIRIRRDSRTTTWRDRQKKWKGCDDTANVKKERRRLDTTPMTSLDGEGATSQYFSYLSRAR